MSLKLLLFFFISRCWFTDVSQLLTSLIKSQSKITDNKLIVIEFYQTKRIRLFGWVNWRTNERMVHFVVLQLKGIGNHGGNCESGGILSNRLSLPLPLTACHRCDVCGKLLSTKLTLKRHKEQQHLQPLNNAVCNLCHKVFRTLNSLNNHKSIYHRRQKHQLYSAHPPGQNLPPHHLTQLSQSNAAKLEFI